MRDRRAERPRRGALGIDVDPLRIVGRRRERVDPLLRHLEPRRRARARRPRARASRRSRGRLRSPPARRASDVVLAEELEALVQAGRDARAGHGDADRQVHRPRLLAEVVAELLQRDLDLRRRPRLDRRRAPPPPRRGSRASSSAGSGSTSWNRKPGEARELAEPPDLLLHDRRGRAHALLGPVDALLAQVADEARPRTRPARARAGRRRSSSRASRSRRSPGSSRRARARSARPARRADMIVVSPSGAQPSSARKFMSASGDVAGRRGTRRPRPRRAASRASCRPRRRRSARARRRAARRRARAGR